MQRFGCGSSSSGPMSWVFQSDVCAVSRISESSEPSLMDYSSIDDICDGFCHNLLGIEQLASFQCRECYMEVRTRTNSTSREILSAHTKG